MNKSRYFYMNTAELLDKVFDLYKKTVGYQILKSIIFGFAALIVIPLVILLIALFAGPLITSISLSSQSQVSSFVLIFAIIGIPAILLGCVLEAFEISGGVLLTEQAFHGKKVDFGAMFSRILSSFFPAFTTILTVFFIFLPIIAMFIGVLYFVINNYYSQLINSNDSLSILTSAVGVGTAIGIALLVFWNGMNSFLICAVPTAVCEGKLGISSVKQSVSLLKGSYAKIFGTLILWMLINLVTQNSFSAIIALSVQVFTFYYDDPIQIGLFASILTIISNLLTIAVSVLMMPFQTILTSVIYFNQKVLKDGLDLIIELDKSPDVEV